jgi:hypothetical protein
MGRPIVKLNGKVSPKAMGKYSPGSALGAASFIAAGTAMYEPLAANTESIKRSALELVTA